MSSFYEKLSMKIQGETAAAAGTKDPSPAKSVTYSATGDRTSPKKDDQPAVQPAVEAVPDGTDSIDIDLFQSDARMIVFMQASGVPADGFTVTLSEESNTMVVEATQKRPNPPPAEGAKEGDPMEKGIYTKQEIKWKSLYRKVYLPASFDGGEAEAFLQAGILVIVLPTKHPGTGKKLVVQEIMDDGQKK